MYRISKIFLLVVCVTVAMAQSPEPPISDTRIPVHTLVREDLFAGYLADDMERLTRGEKNIQALLEKRPEAKSSLLAWKASATLYRAVLAHENNRNEEFLQKYREALDLFTQAHQIGKNDVGVPAITAGTYVLFSDRLPKEHRAAAWSQAYESFHALWKLQAPAVDKLPLHFRGELLAGLATSAMRTGRTDEANQHLDKIPAVLSNTPYESVARKWKENPKAAADTSITCMTCHEAGRLAARLNTLNSSK